MKETAKFPKMFVLRAALAGLMVTSARAGTDTRQAGDHMAAAGWYGYYDSVRKKKLPAGLSGRSWNFASSAARALGGRARPRGGGEACHR